ncbi:MAG: alpha/beta fold hydrolase [Actinomycetota bacterium]
MIEATDLAYEERGSGPVAVFVHGFPFDRTMWIGQLAGLAKHRRCIAIDLRGSGLSQDKPPREYSMDLFADDIAKTLDDIGADKIDLVGLSMGGYVLFSFFRRHHDKLRSLVLFDTKPDADTDEGKKGREATAALVREKGMEALWDGLKTKLFGANPSEEAVQKIYQMVLSTDPDVAAAQSLAMRDRVDSTGDLGNIDVPTLWIHGKDDALMPPDAAEASAGKIPGAKFVAISGGHVSPLEHPDEANAALTDFFKSLPK